MSTIYGTTNAFPGTINQKLVQLVRTGTDHYLRVRVPDTLAHPLPALPGPADDLLTEPNRFTVVASPNHLLYGSPHPGITNVWYNNPAILTSRFLIQTSYTCPIELYPEPSVSARVGMLVKDIDGTWFVPSPASFPRRCTHDCEGGSIIPAQISYCRNTGYEYDNPSGGSSSDSCESTGEPFPSNPLSRVHTIDWIGLVLQDGSHRLGIGLGLWQFLEQSGQNQVLYSYLYPTGFSYDNGYMVFVQPVPCGGSAEWARFEYMGFDTYRAYYGSSPIFIGGLVSGANVMVGVQKLLLEAYTGSYSDDFNETHQMMFETVGYCSEMKSSSVPVQGVYEITDTRPTPHRWRLRPKTNGQFLINGQPAVYNPTGDYWQPAVDTPSTNAVFRYELQGNQLLDRHEHWSEAVQLVTLEARWSARFQQGSPFVGRARRGDLLEIEYKLSQNGMVDIYLSDSNATSFMLLAGNVNATANTWQVYTSLPPADNEPLYFKVVDKSDPTRFVLLELWLDEEPTFHPVDFAKYPLRLLGLDFYYTQAGSSVYGGWFSDGRPLLIQLGAWDLEPRFVRYLEIRGR